MIDLKPDSRHHRDRTLGLAAHIDAASRTLVYATMPGKNGLSYPGDVYRVIGELRSTVGGCRSFWGSSGSSCAHSATPDTCATTAAATPHRQSPPAWKHSAQPKP